MRHLHFNIVKGNKISFRERDRKIKVRNVIYLKKYK